MNILLTIVPIFTVIGIGWLARECGFIPSEFMGPANRLVFYVSIPAMVFRAVSQGDFLADFNVGVLLIALAAMVVLFWVALALAAAAHVAGHAKGTFVQSSFHGNLGYIGLATCYYFLGDAGFAGASILIGFMMIFQNLLAVFVLSFDGKGPAGPKPLLSTVGRVAGNPIILSAIAGVVFSFSRLRVPEVVGRSLDILSGMGLPMALILIGSSLTFDLMRSRLVQVMLSSLMKLVLLPGLGFALYRAWHIAPSDYAPGLILLATPSATITYVMAREMNGDADLAVATISTSTLLSALTLTLWLGVLQR